jgi:hypothetical protein
MYYDGERPVIEPESECSGGGWTRGPIHDAALLHLSPAATEDAIRLLDGRLGGLKVAQTVEICWRRDR